VELLNELLLALDHRNRWRQDAREAEPVTHMSLFKRIKNHVTDSNVKMKLHEGAPAHEGLNWVARSTIWSAVQVHHRLTNSEREEVAEVRGPGILDLLQQDVVATGWRNSHGEIEILGGARGLEPEFHGITAFQDPVCIRPEKKPGEESIKGYLPAQPL
jgi:hypothetical protein